MTDRQRRIEKLVVDIGSALDRGVSAERIHAELIRRRMPSDKATLLMGRILAARSGEAGSPVPSPSAEPQSPGPVEVARRRSRYRRTPIFLALAVLLVASGFTGLWVVNNSREAAELRALELTAEAMRLDTEVAQARNHLEHIESRIEERRVDAEQIEWLRARVASGPGSFDSLEDYESMLGIYERRRARWNRTLSTYRVVSQAFRTLADIHNAKLDSLNAVRRLAPASTVPAQGTVQHMRITAVALAQ